MSRVRTSDSIMVRKEHSISVSWLPFQTPTGWGYHPPSRVPSRSWWSDGSPHQWTRLWPEIETKSTIKFNVSDQKTYLGTLTLGTSSAQNFDDSCEDDSGLVHVALERGLTVWNIRILIISCVVWRRHNDKQKSIVRGWRLQNVLIFLVLLERSHEGGLLGVGLEPSVTKLGGGVDELEVDLLQSPLLGVGQQRLTQGQQPLLGSNAATLILQD